MVRILCHIPSLRFEPWTILIAPIKWHLGHFQAYSTCLDLADNWDFYCIKLNDFEVLELIR